MNKDESKIFGNIVLIGVSILILSVIWFVGSFIYNFYQSYGDQLDYVCFNHQCDYIKAKDYSINWEGTCLSRTDSGATVKQCGGSIEATKSDIGFFDRIRKAYNKTVASCPDTVNGYYNESDGKCYCNIEAHFDSGSNKCVF